MEKKRLTNPDIYPSDEVLAEAIGDSYTAFKKISEKLPNFTSELEWRYYNDGKSWLGKENRVLAWSLGWMFYDDVLFY